MKWLDNRIVNQALKIVGRTAEPSGLTLDWPRIMSGEWLSTDASAAAQQSFANLVWVFICVRAKMQFGAMVPLRAYQVPRGKGEEAKELLPYEHNAQAILRKVNPRFTRFNLIEQMIGYGELTGKILVLKESGNVTGYKKPPDELWALRPDYLRRINYRKGTGLIESFEIGSPSGDPRILPAEQVIYIPYFHPYADGDGLAPTKPLTRTMETEIYAQDHYRSLLKADGVPPYYLQVEKFLTKDQRMQVLTGWLESFSGARKGKPALAFGGITVKEMAQTALEMDLKSTRETNRDEIISAFGCYPAVVGVAQADRARAEADMRMFAQNTMVPLLTMLAEYLTEFLMPDFGERIICAFDYSQVAALKDDETAKATIVSQLTQGNNPILSPNEARKLYFNLPPRKGGDVILVPMTLVEGGSGATEAPRAKRDATAVTHTPAQAKRWANYVRRVDIIEGHACKWLREAFDKQQAVCLDALGAGRARRGFDDLDDALMGAAFAEPTRDALKKIIWAAAKQGIEHGNEPLADLGLAFDLDNPALVEYLTNHAYEASKFVNDTTTQAIRTILADAQEQGGTLTEITDRVRSAMTAMFDEAKAGRAKTIARTEVQIGVQHTQQAAWKDSEVVEQKEWISSQSPNMRPEHGAINGQRVGIDEEFTLGDGTRVMYPGDDAAGNPAMTINCLCDMAPVVSEKAKMDYLGRQLEAKLLPATGKGSRTWETKRNSAKVLLGS